MSYRTKKNCEEEENSFVLMDSNSADVDFVCNPIALAFDTSLDASQSNDEEVTSVTATTEDEDGDCHVVVGSPDENAAKIPRNPAKIVPLIELNRSCSPSDGSTKPHKTSRSPLSPFLVKKRTPTAHQPLLVGGARKRDSSGRCVSEAFFKLSVDDTDSAPPPCNDKKRRPPLATLTEEPLTISENSQVSSFHLTVTSDNVKLSMNRKTVFRQSKLTGDYITKHLLPTVRDRQTDLQCITPTTLSGIICGEAFKNEIEKVYLVDCRYPFEYTSGHIQGAMNLYRQEDIHAQFFQQSPSSRENSKRKLVVFYCEFSSQRGPSMIRAMRNHDRTIHRTQYPYLSYPELYLLQGGYKAFFQEFKGLCEPPFYLPMNSVEHRGELASYITKSRSFHDFSQAQTQGRKGTVRRRP